MRLTQKIRCWMLPLINVVCNSVLLSTLYTREYVDSIQVPCVEEVLAAMAGEAGRERKVKGLGGSY